ncbi:MAG: DUF6599 family protein [Acidobacteriota bacterium]
MLFALSAVVSAEVTIGEAAKLLPDKIESVRASGPAQMPMRGIFELVSPDEVGAVSSAERTYESQHNSSFSINVIHVSTESGAFALLTRIAGQSNQTIQPGAIGTAAIVTSSRIVFYKGGNLVQVSDANTVAAAQDELLQMARAFAATLPSGDDDIPVLVKHLPNSPANTGTPLYAVTLNGLKSIVPAQPTLDALTFEGGAEAVTANYGQSRLVIVEFTTPQFSIDSDLRIAAKIQELKSQGQPVPTAYRRVGNYSVFVFNALDEKTANELIEQVKYEQVVQWLGDDPHLSERLQRYFAQTTAGVLVSVLKGSGLSLILCVGAGALIGTLMFRHRRAQKATAYSDAGGSVRLNLDELTSTINSDRLLGPVSTSEPDPNSLK